VPIQRELIQKSLLNEQEIKWLNDYHEMCFSIIGEELKRANKPDALAWLREQTRPL